MTEGLRQGPTSTQERDAIFGVAVSVDEAAVVLFGVPWEATTSYGRGTANGPRAILHASVQVDLFDLELGEPYRAGIVMLDEDEALRDNAHEAAACALEVIAACDRGEAPPADALARVNALSAWQEAHVEATAGAWLARRKRVGVIGGDHSVAYGSIAAHAACHPGMGVLQFDAHADLRVAYHGFVGSHASIMHRVMSEIGGVSKLVSVGVRDLCREEHDAITASAGRIVAFFDADLRRMLDEGEPFKRIASKIAEQLPSEVYVSFDIDGLDPALCPNTGTPVPGGLSFHQALSVLDAIVDSGRRIVGFDLCEVAPGRDEWDANVGARLLYKLIGYLLAPRR